MNISKHFTRKELACPCCGKFAMDVAFIMEFLERVREGYGKPMFITSGFRCERHNLKVGGSKNSAHKLGLAVDVACQSSADRYDLIQTAMNCGAVGIGVYDTFLHLDRKPRPSRVMWLG